MAWDVGGHVIGRIIKGPKLSVLADGAVVANFTVEASPRRFDKDTRAWKEIKPVVVRCNAWHAMAPHVMASVHRGDRVLVVGRMQSNCFTEVDGTQKSLMELDVDAMGPDLRYADVQILTADPAV